MNDNYDVIRETAVEHCIKHLAKFSKDEAVRFKLFGVYQFGVIKDIKYNDVLDRIEYDIIANNKEYACDIPERLLIKINPIYAPDMCENDSELSEMALF